ncbi:MAG: LamG domain-containing protein [Pseudomonadota bacterium]|nr:LamG domain-containing protein [Pseudomonadota bacterium]
MIKQTMLKTALFCDGYLIHAQVPHYEQLALAVLTLEAWINPKGQGIRTIISKGDGGWETNYALQLREVDGQALLALLWHQQIYWCPQVPIPNDTWSHVAVTVDREQRCRFFINGQQQASGLLSQKAFLRGQHELLIGMCGTQKRSELFAGEIAELRVWNRARSEQEIKATMEQPLLRINGLVSCWRFEQDMAKDYAHNYDGQIIRTVSYIKDLQIRQILYTQLAGHLSRDIYLRIPDNEYYCPSLADTKALIEQTAVERFQPLGSRFDADDFALVLKAEFAKDAYRAGIRRAPYCFGIVWAGEANAYNCIINDDLRLRLIQPQTDEIFLPRQHDNDIRFIYI